MAANVAFEDFDSPPVYKQSLARAHDDSTHNFVVGFGQKQAKIAFNVSAENVQELLKTKPLQECPVRWINIWGPHLQTNLIDVLGSKYGFSPRLCAIIKSEPIRWHAGKERVSKYDKQAQSLQKDDLEVAAKSLDTTRTSSRPQGDDDFSHYAIAKNMEHYQSNDIGAHFICIGANWLHVPAQSEEKRNKRGRKRIQTPLWTWLVLCDDHTVISIHEDPGPTSSAKVLTSIRQNTISILSQLSTLGHEAADPISIQTIRQTLDLETKGSNPGLEGSSNLFYYLFDDWRAVYSTISRYRKTLEALEEKIIHDMTRTSTTSADIEIIPALHDLGSQIHKSDHLYAGYQKTISRILTARVPQLSNDTNSANPGSQEKPPQSIVLAQSAAHRFERLSDRIQLVILNTTQELLAEKDALVNTYFNINAQKDSEATARLSRAATLLAKLSVLFLPVSLMTSYFSVQIPELQTYTSRDYWYAFAVIFSISFVSLFFFSKLLMWVTETLDHGVKVLAKMARERWPGRRTESTHPHDDGDECDDKLD